MGRGRRAAHERPAEPRRRCIGCRKARPQRELLRLTAAGTGRLPGRGCYLCKSRDCATRALKTGQIKRALKGQGTEPPLARLLEWMGLPLA